MQVVVEAEEKGGEEGGTLEAEMVVEGTLVATGTSEAEEEEVTLEGEAEEGGGAVAVAEVRLLVNRIKQVQSLISCKSLSTGRLFMSASRAWSMASCDERSLVLI